MTAIDRFNRKVQLEDPRRKLLLRAMKALANGAGWTRAAADIGVAESTLRRWVAKARRKAEKTRSR